MRVISGTARGTGLFSPQGTETRPTSDFVKESLFNIIQADLGGASFLDLFAGSGAIGIEALSRGASSATFVDISQKSISLIKRNLAKTRLEQRASIIKSDTGAAIKKIAGGGQKFNIIFLDPPYFEGLVEKILTLIVAENILAKDGYIILEMSKTEAVPNLDGLEISREREYSGARLVFYALPDYAENI